LRALCTEAALNAVRRRYLRIYRSGERLVVDLATIKVEGRDFMGAIKSESELGSFPSFSFCCMTIFVHFRSTLLFRAISFLPSFLTALRMTVYCHLLSLYLPFLFSIRYQERILIYSLFRIRAVLCTPRLPPQLRLFLLSSSRSLGPFSNIQRS
jgi:hypothetical protein